MITAILDFRDMITGLFAKPVVGTATAIGGGIGGLLTWIGILTPIIGFVAAIIGLIAGIYTLKNQMKINKDLNKSKQ